MSRRSTGHWVGSTRAAEWLGVKRPLLRTFLLHCRHEDVLPEAWDYDAKRRPALALNTEHIWNNWTEWESAYAAWRRRRH
jgi:hypothetical protein